MINSWRHTNFGIAFAFNSSMSVSPFIRYRHQATAIAGRVVVQRLP